MNTANAGDVARINLVQGMTTISGISALLLFYSGCTHSFISCSLARKLGLKHIDLDPPLIVSTPQGDKISTNKQVGLILMYVQGTSIVSEFVVYHLVEIDLILWIDWFFKTM